MSQNNISFNLETHSPPSSHQTEHALFLAILTRQRAQVLPFPERLDNLAILDLWICLALKVTATIIDYCKRGKDSLKSALLGRGIHFPHFLGASSFHPCKIEACISLRYSIRPRTWKFSPFPIDLTDLDRWKDKSESFLIFGTIINWHDLSERYSSTTSNSTRKDSMSASRSVCHFLRGNRHFCQLLLLIATVGIVAVGWMRPNRNIPQPA